MIVAYIELASVADIAKLCPVRQSHFLSVCFCISVLKNVMFWCLYPTKYKILAWNFTLRKRGTKLSLSCCLGGSLFVPGNVDIVYT